MKKILVGLMATMFLAFSFGTLSASTIENGVLVAANDKCGADGACGGEKSSKKCGDGKKVIKQKCGLEKKNADAKCGSEKRNADTKCGSETKSNKCGSEKKIQSKCGSN